jgi:hypothetical protein
MTNRKKYQRQKNPSKSSQNLQNLDVVKILRNRDTECFLFFSYISGSSVAHLPRTELAPEYAEGSGIEKDKQQLT